MLINLLVIPILEKVAKALEEKAAETPAEWDDVVAGALRTVIEFFKTPGVVKET
jgi:hypothetical protein